jgi:hypothetical protein
MVHSSLSQLPVVKALSKQEITESQSKFYRMVVAAKEEGAASSVKDFIIKLSYAFGMYIVRNLTGLACCVHMQRDFQRVMCHVWVLILMRWVALILDPITVRKHFSETPIV